VITKTIERMFSATHRSSPERCELPLGFASTHIYFIKASLSDIIKASVSDIINATLLQSSAINKASLSDTLKQHYHSPLTLISTGHVAEEEPLRVAEEEPLHVAEEEPLHVAEEEPLHVAEEEPLLSTTGI
jgi:hypothetical protein